MRKFNCGVIVGRFSPIHIGHENLINIALKDCKKVVVIVTSNNNIDNENPYSIDYRLYLINKIYKKQIEEKKLILTSLTSSKKIDITYGDIVLDIVKEVAKTNADYIIYGSDKNIEKCFSREKIQTLYCKVVDRSLIPISATKIRKLLKEDNIDMLKKCLNESILEEYEKLKNI